MARMMVYLDNCCYNRPYDDQSNLMICMEAQAKLVIQQMIRDKEIGLVWSDVLSYENSRNPFEERKVSIAQWAQLATVCVDMNEAIVAMGKELCLLGMKNMDALHIASAINGGADFFITVDKGILKRDINGIMIKTPYGFLKECVL